MGEDWQCQVTPFSDTEAGTSESSNTLAITDTGSSPTPKIMLVGDSITLGSSSTGTVGFRRALSMSVDAMYASRYPSDTDFLVGSLTSGSRDDFDRDHEGHSGWQANQIETEIIGWLDDNPADIVALHIWDERHNQRRLRCRDRR